ncbi:36766_t:CDS:2, partial [Racocetra persica]
DKEKLQLSIKPKSNIEVKKKMVKYHQKLAEIGVNKKADIDYIYKPNSLDDCEMLKIGHVNRAIELGSKSDMEDKIDNIDEKNNEFSDKKSLLKHCSQNRINVKKIKQTY